MTIYLDALLARFHEGLSDATDRAALADSLIEVGRDDLARRVRLAEGRTCAAADAFIEDVCEDWDSLDPYLATAERGLAGPDEQTLRDLCGEVETASHHDLALADVMLYVLGHVAVYRLEARA